MDIAYTSHVRIERIKGSHRLAYLPALETPIEFGVHSAVAAHYGAQPDRERTTTLDYFVASTAG